MQLSGDRLADRDDSARTSRQRALEARENCARQTRRIRLEVGIQLVRVVDESRPGLLREEISRRQRVEVIRVHDVDSADRSSGTEERGSAPSEAKEPVEPAQLAQNRAFSTGGGSGLPLFVRLALPAGSDDDNVRQWYGFLAGDATGESDDPEPE